MQKRDETRQLGEQEETLPQLNGLSDQLEANTQEKALAAYKSPVPDRLRVVFPDKSVKVFNSLHPQLVIGRRTQNNYGQVDVDMSPFDDGVQGVSRIHAVIVPETSGLVIKDMQSTNGTFINSRKLMPVQPYPLADGDNIKVGNLRIELYFEYTD